MQKLLFSSLLAGLLLVGGSAQALVSYCGSGPDQDSFYHRASLGFVELTYPFVTTWMETHVSGPISPSLYSVFFNTINSWHFFLNMPPGTYYWQGYALVEVDDPDFFWRVLDTSLCFGAVSIPEPPFCESEEVKVTGSTTLTNSIHSYLVSAIRSGFEAVEKLGVCSVTGAPGFTGSLKLENVSQCCEAEQRTDSATRASGNASFSVPLLSCSVKQILVPAYGIVLEGSIGAGATASLGYSGMNAGMCGTASQPITLSGTVSGGFGGEIGVGGISTRVVGAGVRLSDTFSISARGPDVYNLSLSGCVGPAEITGWVRFLGNEVKTQIVPREWAEGTRLCL